jgi:hypothetical protein
VWAQTGLDSWAGQFHYTGPSSAYFDSISYSSLLRNPGFEAGGTAALWENWGSSAIDANNAYSGRNALRIGSAGGGMGQVIGEAPVVGATYTLSGAGKVSVMGETGWIGVDFLDSSGAKIGNSSSLPFTSTAYTRPSLITPAVPAGTVGLRVWCWKNAGLGGYFYCDELRLTRN